MHNTHMMKKQTATAYCVETLQGLHYLKALNRAEALRVFAQQFPQLKVRDAWKSSQYGKTLPVDRVSV